jgi:hypothetical protein
VRTALFSSRCDASIMSLNSGSLTSVCIEFHPNGLEPVFAEYHIRNISYPKPEGLYT